MEVVRLVLLSVQISGLAAQRAALEMRSLLDLCRMDSCQVDAPGPPTRYLDVMKGRSVPRIPPLPLMRAAETGSGQALLGATNLPLAVARFYRFRYMRGGCTIHIYYFLSFQVVFQWYDRIFFWVGFDSNSCAWLAPATSGTQARRRYIWDSHYSVRFTKGSSIPW
jgi:hypothetical protein